MELAELQALLYRLIVAPEGVEQGLAAERALPLGGFDGLIASDDRLSARERVEIYANGYFHRLLEVFKEDYPATLAVAGDSHFHNLITGYLIDYPPTEPSIYHAGRDLPAFLRTHPLRDRWPFMADLALLERALVEIYHAPDATPLTPFAMSSIPPDEWGAVQMRTNPASRMLQVEWHVEETLRAVETNAAWVPPARGPLRLLVWRKGMNVFYRELEALDSDALSLARDGTTFAAMCEVIAKASVNEEPAVLISRLLGRWLSAELLVRDA
jgi:hypothetical protein